MKEGSHNPIQTLVNKRRRRKKRRKRKGKKNGEQ
jgi:hypothetical protein